MTAQNLQRLRLLTDKWHGCVVVSAIGREHPKDAKITDLLVAHFNGDDSAWKKIEAKYNRLAKFNWVQIDIEQLLFEARKRATKHDLAYCMSLGEELSARVASAFLCCDYVEAEQVVRFDSCGKLLWRETKKNLRSAFRGVRLGVMGGFYGGVSGVKGERAVFSRGGGDVSGSICAAALDSSLYENFTDVNGVCTANPKRVSGAKTISAISYEEMFRLAESGAEVLHPQAVRFAMRTGIPICVRNFLNEASPSTLVSFCPSHVKFLAVTEKQTRKGMLTSILLCMDLTEIACRLAWLFAEVRKAGASVSCCKVCNEFVQLLSDKSILPLAHAVFSAKF